MTQFRVNTCCPTDIIQKKTYLKYTLRYTLLPEDLKAFGEANDVLDHVSGEVSHMRKSSKNAAFSDLFALLVLNKIRETGGGGEGASTRGYSRVCGRFIKCSAGVCRAVGQWVSSLACRPVVFTHRDYLSIHRLKKETMSVRQQDNGNDSTSNCILPFVYTP